MPIVGLRNTENFATNERPQNWREGLLRLYPNSSQAAKAPLTALTAQMKSEVTDDPVYHWWEKKLDDRRFKLSGTITAADTALPIETTWKTNASAKIAKAGDVIYVEQTGELLRVAEDPVSDSVLTVQRGVAGSTATLVNTGGAGINPYMFIIGSAFEENSDAPSGVNYDPVERYNYTQIFRSTLEMSRTAAKTRLRTVQAVKEARRECLEYIGIDMERAWIFGRRYATTKNGNPLRYTGGMLWYLETYAPNNIISVPSATIDGDYIDLIMSTIFKYGSQEKIAFGGMGALATINAAVRKNAQYNISSDEKEYGMRITRLISPFGTLVFKDHPLFTQMEGGTVAGSPFYGMTNWMLVLDMDNIRYRYLTGSDLDYQPELEANGIDGMKSGYLAECGLEFNHPETHFLFKNVSIAATDT
jgi:hypothetical protein